MTEEETGQQSGGAAKEEAEGAAGYAGGLT